MSETPTTVPLPPVPLYDFANPQTRRPRTSTKSGDPRFWEERAPQESWSKNLPSIAIPAAMYEELQELAMSPDYEFGGKITPIIRQAVEEFLVAHMTEGPKASLFRQMVAFRDSFVEEILASEFLNQVTVIETSLNRWRNANEIEQLVALMGKVTENLNRLPDTWRGFVIDQLRENKGVKEAFDYAYKVVGHTMNEDQRKEIDITHGIIYG